MDLPSYQVPCVVKTLFTITLLELLIGGGGRLFEVGPVTFRMILFVICLCVGFLVTIARMEKDEGDLLSIILVTVYLFLHITGILIGLTRTIISMLPARRCSSLFINRQPSSLRRCYIPTIWWFMPLCWLDLQFYCWL
jgi:hypothetical protein